MKLFLLLLISWVFLGTTQVPGDQELPIGIWTNEEKEARFQVYKCGEKLCGKIVWLKEPLQDGKPKIDRKNPTDKLKTQPILGMVFMQNFVYEGNRKWDNGTIYDPKTGKTYSCYLKILTPDKMEVKGYIGISLVGRSQIWTRVR